MKKTPRDIESEIAHAHPRPTRPNPRRVLVCSGRIERRALLAGVYRADGDRATECADANELTGRVPPRREGAGETVDLVVADARDATTDVLEAVEKLRARRPDLPVAVVTRRDDSGVVRRAEKAGATLLKVPIVSAALKKLLG